MQFTKQSHRFALSFALLLSAVLTTVGCSDSPTGEDDSANNSPQAITSDYYIQAQVDGKYKTVQINEDPSVNMGMGNSSHEGDIPNGYRVSHTTFFSTVHLLPTGPEIDRKGTFAITFIGDFDEDPYRDEDYDPLITRGSMAFAGEEQSGELKEGVAVGWIDENNQEWSTAFGTGEQNGSSFIVTSKETIEYPQPWLGPYVLYDVKGTFNCTLYDKSGNSITVTNGKFAIASVLR